MYTLRTFKDKGKIDRLQIYLGDCYSVLQPSKEDEKIGIKLRVVGNYDSTTKDGLAVHKDEHAYIMTSRGETFETLNRP
ncbi:hypothetical protein J0X14_14225 [Muricauda sp. CAU 1633]|uniref:hypothetical protein n=1 Tax=Allomuricauda sp. CAU 1633 TaxID=2816036 RepID=UPI001A8D0F8B|nr:hypothetical protein [Muricauda sp. CAU 1633]MBO0323461.1 hypothetical protein [Muricauda sp. CAU 1633]